MHETSKCLLVEPLVFGRIASGERLKSAKIRDHIEIRKNGSIHFLISFSYRITLLNTLEAPQLRMVHTL